jgi:hypothetical protein
MRDFEEFQMTRSQATRSIIDTHWHIFGPKLRQKFVENIGFDDSKPLPRANPGEIFFYRELVPIFVRYAAALLETLELKLIDPTNSTSS